MESIDKELSSSMEEAFIEAAKICEESDPANLFSSSFDDVLVAEAMAVEALAAEGLAIEGVAAKGVTDKGATKECLGEKGVIEEAFFDDDQEEMSSSVDKLLEDTAKVYDEIRSPNLLTEDELMLALESDPDNLRLEAGEGVDRSIESYMKVLVKAVMKDKQVINDLSIYIQTKNVYLRLSHTKCCQEICNAMKILQNKCSMHLSSVIQNF